MAKLVRLFSPGYRFGDLITLNMASFRPKEAAVPLLLGLDIYDSIGETSVRRFSVTSLLARAWKKTLETKEEAPFKPLKTKGEAPFKHGEGLSFIFDELNSLDIDTQGALLRFLESSELLGLGDFEHKIEDVDALIVGVMNEDPFSITKSRTLDRVLRDKQIFGGMLGDYLYEIFRGQRRLRDDLYFRMVRGGEIILPELRERREDIPILFHFIVERELLPSIQETKYEIELSTYEALMSPSFQWEGNVRELQTLAREIFTLAYDDYKTRRRSDEAARLTLRGSHVHSARQNLTRVPASSPDVLVQST
jgi:DNA-binding NtrC family response regulator